MFPFWTWTGPYSMISSFTITMRVFGLYSVGKTWPTRIVMHEDTCVIPHMPLQSWCVCVCDCNAVVTQQQGLRGQPERAHYTPALFTLTLTNCGGEYTHTHTHTHTWFCFLSLTIAPSNVYFYSLSRNVFTLGMPSLGKAASCRVLLGIFWTSVTWFLL